MRHLGPEKSAGVPMEWYDANWVVGMPMELN
jgi:hypothetical protein